LWLLISSAMVSAESASCSPRTGQIGHVRAPLIEDQVEAGAEAIPPLLQRLDAAVAAADLRGRSCRRKGRLGDAMPTCQRQFSERRLN
jgi:hypothetical protein